MAPRASRRVRWLLVLALVLAGCSAPVEKATVEAPAGTSWATCPPAASRPFTLALFSVVENETGGRPAGIHRLDAKTFLWVWGQYEETLREDRVTRVNAVDIARDSTGLLHLCTRVDVAAPTEVDGEPRTYGVGVRFGGRDSFPEGPVRVTVNWVAGCACDPLPRGNATALFD